MNMEGVMTDYSELVILFLMLPAATQIILPLLTLIGFGLIRVVKTVFGEKKFARGVREDIGFQDDLLLSRS